MTILVPLPMDMEATRQRVRVLLNDYFSKTIPEETLNGLIDIARQRAELMIPFWAASLFSIGVGDCGNAEAMQSWVSGGNKPNLNATADVLTAWFKKKDDPEESTESYEASEALLKARHK